MKKLLVLPILFMSLLTMAGEGYKVGDKVKDFSLKNVDGEMVSMKDNASAKGYIVIFTCNHCPFAKMYEDRIIELHKKYVEKGYPVIAINPNDPKKKPEDSFENMKKRAKEKNYPFPYLVDETQGVAKAFGATRTPHVFIVRKKKSDFILRYIGAIDDNAKEASGVEEKFVEDAVNALLAGKPMAKTHTKAIGCTIKWKS